MSSSLSVSMTDGPPPRGNEVHAALAAVAHPSWPAAAAASSSQHRQPSPSSCCSTPPAHLTPSASPPISSTTTPTFTTATARIHSDHSPPSPTYLTEPDAYDPELDVQLLLQRQRLHRLRTIDRPTSLLAKLKPPSSLFGGGSRNAVSSPPQTSYGAQPSTPLNTTLSLPSAETPPHAMPATTASVESEGSKRKGLPREYGEVSQDVEIWMPDHRGLAGSSRLPFGPKVTRKLTRHNSSASHRLPTANSSPTSGAHEPGRFKQFSPARLREKPSKLKFGSSTAAASSQPGGTGSWSKGRLTLRDNDVLYILEEGALLHPLRASALRPTDVRPVDDSLLSRANVLGIFALPSNFAGGRSFDWDSYSPQSGSTDSGQVESPAPVAPILLCFPSAIRMRQWIALLRSCGTSEVYGGPSSIVKGGTHRWHRQVDIHISAFRFLASATSPSPSSPRAQEVMLPFAMTEAPPSPTNVLSRVKSLMSDTSTDQEVDEPARSRPRAAVLERSTSAMSQASISSSASGDVSAVSCEDSSAAAGTSAPLPRPAPPPSKPEQTRRDRESSASMPAVNFTSLSCMVVCDDIVLGRTEARAPQSASGSVSWDDPTISLYNPWPLRTLRVDLQAAVGPSRATQQRGLTLGSVEFHIDTMRRGEDIEGWFPVWATSVRESYPPQLSISDECIGEVNLKIKVEELAVLQKRKYKDIENALNNHNCTQLINGLALHLNESVIMDYLVEVYASSGTIADRLINLIDAEQKTWNKAPLELLFRSHSLVTRCLEKFQRLHCQHWLDASIGDLVRRICEERITVDSDAVQAGEGGATLAMNSKDADTLHSWVVAIWESIYVNRQKCPKDLQKVLTKVRQATNSAFVSHGPSAGVQGVGCFVFLRLMCAAMINPQLYGLTATMPEPEVSKTLKSIAKVLNALANKRGPAAHYDKDLGQLNDFLHEQSAAFDDYIVSVSSYTESSSSTKANKGGGGGGGDVNDALIQRIIDRKAPRLPLLHRESILRGPYMLDQPVALAAFVSYVARTTEASIFDGAGGDEAGSNNDETRSAEAKVQSFIEACCELESLVGWYIDRAGFEPQPLNLAEWARVTGTPYSTVVSGKGVAAYRPSAAVAASAEGSSSYADSHQEQQQQQQSQSLTSRSGRRRATVSAAASQASQRGFEGRASPKPDPAVFNEAHDHRLAETLSRQQQLHRPNVSRPSTSTGQSTVRRRSVDTALADAAVAAAAANSNNRVPATSNEAASTRPAMRNRGASVGNAGAGGDGKKTRWWRRIV